MGWQEEYDQQAWHDNDSNDDFDDLSDDDDDNRKDDEGVHDKLSIWK